MVEALELSRTSESVVRSAKNNLAAWKITPEQIKHLNVEGGDYRQAVDVFADVSGTVVRKLAVEGEVAASSHMGQPTALFDVADLSRVWAVFEVYEADLRHIRAGAEVEFWVAAFPEKKFTDRVSYIGDSVDPVARTTVVRVEVANPGRILKPEMLARGRLKARQPGAAGQLSVPKSAVLWTGERSVVYVKNPDYTTMPVFEYREVTLGGSAGGRYMILDGLRAGGAVVLNGAFQVDVAAQLQNKRSMMRPTIKGDGQPAPNFVDQ